MVQAYIMANAPRMTHRASPRAQFQAGKEIGTCSGERTSPFGGRQPPEGMAGFLHGSNVPN